MIVPTKELLLVQYLFREASKALARNQANADGLSVSLLQDAAELMAVTVLRAISGEIPKIFDQFWDAVEKVNHNGKRLPHRAAMQRLNKARVNFKHYGIIPAHTQAIDFEAHTERFLETTCADFFGVPLRSVSPADLIGDSDVSTHLRNAARKLENHDFNGVIEECAVARHFAGELIAKVVPSVGTQYSLRQSGPNTMEAAFGNLAATVTAMRSFLLTTVLGLSMADQARLKSLLPGVSMSPFTKAYQLQYWHQGSPTREDAEFSLRVVTDYALAVEEATQLFSDRPPPG